MSPTHSNCEQTYSDCSGKVDNMHANAEVFDNDAEAVFRLIQIFTSCCASFAHGANDIANAMGPFMTVYGVYHAGKVDKSNDVSTDSYVVFPFCTIHSYAYRAKQQNRRHVLLTSRIRNIASSRCAFVHFVSNMISNVHVLCTLPTHSIRTQHMH